MTQSKIKTGRSAVLLGLGMGVALVGLYVTILWLGRRAYSDLTDSIGLELVRHEELGDVYQVAWVTADVVAVFTHENDGEDGLWRLSLSTGTAVPESVAQLKPNCLSNKMAFPQGISSSRIAFLSWCSYVDDAGTLEMHRALRQHDLATHLTSTRVEFPDGFFGEDFAVVPNRQGALVVSGGGAYWIEPNRSMERILPSVEYVGSAVPVGARHFIILGGSESPNPVCQGANNIDSPNLELPVCDLLSTQSTVLTPPIRYPLQLRYAAASNLLAFSGAVQGDLGIYVMTLRDHKLYRVWNDQDYFSFSPDGMSLLVVDREISDGKTGFIGLLRLSLPTELVGED